MSTVMMDSIELLEAQKHQIGRRFFEVFFERHPSAAELFGSGSRPKQTEMMQQILTCVIDRAEETPGLSVFLVATGEKHNEYDVEPEMYDWLPPCLLEVIGETCGPSWTPSMDQLWERHLVAICDEMKSVCAPGGDW